MWSPSPLLASVFDGIVYDWVEWTGLMGWGGDSNLMAPDEMRNLGFEEGEGRVEAIPGHAGGATKLRVRDDGKKIS